MQKEGKENEKKRKLVGPTMWLLVWLNKSVVIINTTL